MHWEYVFNKICAVKNKKRTMSKIGLLWRVHHFKWDWNNKYFYRPLPAGDWSRWFPFSGAFPGCGVFRYSQGVDGHSRIADWTQQSHLLRTQAGGKTSVLCRLLRLRIWPEHRLNVAYPKILSIFFHWDHKLFIVFFKRSFECLLSWQHSLRRMKRSLPSANLWSRLCHLRLTQWDFLIPHVSVTFSDIQHLKEANM